MFTFPPTAVALYDFASQAIQSIAVMTKVPAGTVAAVPLLPPPLLLEPHPAIDKAMKGTARRVRNLIS
jgi:hypothetical protein